MARHAWSKLDMFDYQDRPDEQAPKAKDDKAAKDAQESKGVAGWRRDRDHLSRRSQPRPIGEPQPKGADPVPSQVSSGGSKSCHKRSSDLPHDL